MMIHVFQKSRLILKIFSLLLLVSSAACRTAEPVLAPESPPLQQEAEIPAVKAVSYTVEPALPYRDNFGYISVEYKTREELWESARNLLDRKASSADEYERALSRLPLYGKLVINIGRQDLMHANTRWYTYSAFSILPSGEKKQMFSIRGKEGIPNVKGRDGNWWNIVEIPLKEEITHKIEVLVRDNKTGSDFIFTVSRVETLLFN